MASREASTTSAERISPRRIASARDDASSSQGFRKAPPLGVYVGAASPARAALFRSEQSGAVKLVTGSSDGRLTLCCQRLILRNLKRTCDTSGKQEGDPCLRNLTIIQYTRLRSRSRTRPRATGTSMTATG